MKKTVDFVESQILYNTVVKLRGCYFVNYTYGPTGGTIKKNISKDEN